MEPETLTEALANLQEAVEAFIAALTDWASASVAWLARAWRVIARTISIIIGDYRDLAVALADERRNTMAVRKMSRYVRWKERQ